MRTLSLSFFVALVLAACPAPTGEGEGGGEGEEGEGEEGEGEGEGCGDLVLQGAAVEFVNVDAPLPVATGGPFIDGTWVLLGGEIYDENATPGPTGNTLSATMRTSNGTLEIVQDPPGAGFSARFGFATNNETMTLTPQCPDDAEFPATQFTTDGIALQIFLVDLKQVLRFEQQ